MQRGVTVIVCAILCLTGTLMSQEKTLYDIVVYGGTSAGVLAAVQAKNMGKNVALICPEKHLGGMTSSGLGTIDVNKPKYIGGLTREYFHLVWQHYQAEHSWIWEEKQELGGIVKNLDDDKLMWVVEPHVAESIFEALANEAQVDIIPNERLNRIDGVQQSDGWITSIEMESGKSFGGKMFIDASYEGDLMASVASYIVGRESNDLYGETLNGIRLNKKISFNQKFLDPYVIFGNPDSGLLPRIDDDFGGNMGDAHPGIQSYNYRMCLTKHPDNCVMVEKPEGYNEKDYELLFRAIEARFTPRSYFKLGAMPNAKIDANNNGLVSTDYIGMSSSYPEADYATRKKIAKEHELWQRGLIWTLQNHPRVTEKVRAYYQSWGLPKDEFVDNEHWPYVLYVREARRMISSYVVTEHTAMGKEPVPDSVGLASYPMDIHPVRYVQSPEEGIIAEGGLYVEVAPFPISYRAIVPKKKECKNLLVPVCLSASHVAYGSIRMEPVFMILGQSAASAACLAIDSQVALQDLSYDVLREQLLLDKQCLNVGKR